MKVFYSAAERLPIHNAVVTVGSYDGLHYGHRALLEQVKRRAGEEHGESVVVTFWPHPRQVLPGGGDIRLLNTIEEKLYLLHEAGIDNVVVLPFTAEFASMTSAEFLHGILLGKIGMRRFVVGYNHRFGSDGGSFDSPGMHGEQGFVTERIPRLEVNDEKVSSTVVRKLIASGHMRKASELLTRGYIIIADIVDGRVVLRDKAKLLPPAGRYDVEIHSGSASVKSVLHVSPAGEAFVEGYGRGEFKDAVIDFV